MNKRSHVRIVVALRVGAECKLGRTRGTTKNLSCGGLFLLSDAQFPAGTELMLTLDHKMTSLEVRALVTHVRGDGMGLQFIEPPPAVIGELMGVIDDILSTGVDVDGGVQMLEGQERLVLIRRNVLEFVATLVKVETSEVTLEAGEMPTLGESLVVLVPARSEGPHVREIIGASATVAAIVEPRFTCSLKDPTEDFLHAARRTAS